MRVIAITGASAGIGRATAVRLARDGAKLVICARRGDRLDAAAAEITAAGGEALAIVADVANADDLQMFTDRALSRFGRLDVMMANAGFGIYGSLDHISPEQMRRIMDVNYHGTFNAAHAALPVFRRQGAGHLIVISSIVGKRGVPYMGAYAATKFAPVGLAERLRAEVAGSGIHVTVVFPVSTKTEFSGVMMSASGAITRARGPRQPVTAAADAIAKAIVHPVPELYPWAAARGLAVINSLTPGWCDWLVRRWGRKPVARPWPERGAGVPDAAAASGWPAGGERGEAAPPSESERGWGPASREE
jgi:short-subunit dehydrogenase